MTTTEPPTRRRGDGRAAFFGRRAQVKAWLDGGRTLQSYYDEHGAALGITYSQLARYVLKYLRPKAKHDAQQTAATVPTPPARPERPERAKEAIPQFQFSSDENERRLSDLI